MGRKVLSSGCRGERCPDEDWGRGPPCEGERHVSGALGWVCVDRGPLLPQPRDPGSGAEPSPPELGLRYTGVSIVVFHGDPHQTGSWGGQTTCGLWGSQTWAFSHPPGKDTNSPQPQGHNSKVMASRSQSQGHGLGERFSCLLVPSPALVTPELGGRPLSRRGEALGSEPQPPLWAPRCGLR